MCNSVIKGEQALDTTVLTTISENFKQMSVYLVTFSLSKDIVVLYIYILCGVEPLLNCFGNYTTRIPVKYKF